MTEKEAITKVINVLTCLKDRQVIINREDVVKDDSFDLAKDDNGKPIIRCSMGDTVWTDLLLPSDTTSASILIDKDLKILAAKAPDTIGITRCVDYDLNLQDMMVKADYPQDTINKYLQRIDNIFEVG